MSGPQFAAGDAIAFNTQKRKGQTYFKPSWPPASNPGGSVSYYEVHRDGAIVATTTSTSYLDLDAPSSGTYDYIVMAFDPQDRSDNLAGTSSSGGGGGGGGGGNGGNGGGGNGGGNNGKKPPK